MSCSLPCGSLSTLCACCVSIDRRLSHYLSDKKKAEKSALEMAGKLTQQLQVRLVGGLCCAVLCCAAAQASCRWPAAGWAS